MTRPGAAAREHFGRLADAYAHSEGHARGDDLAIVGALAEPEPWMRALDIATGAGHTAVAIAPNVAEMIALDPATEMLDVARRLFADRQITNTRSVAGNAESLPFSDGQFDLLLCRIAPHHFINVMGFVQEVARVLRRGGRFVLEDSCAPDEPELARFINHVEKLRDATHVRSLTAGEWTNILADAELQIDATVPYRKSRGIEKWMDRSGLGEPERERDLVTDR